MEDPSDAGRRAPAQSDGGGVGLRRGLVALATAAVVGVYAAGYVRTEAAAERFQGDEGARRGTPESPPQAEPTTPPTAASTSLPAVGAAPPSAASAPAAAPGSAPARAPSPTQAVAEAAVAAAPTVAPAIAQTTAPAEAPAAAPEAQASEAAPFKDGVFTGWGNSAHGRIEATVEVKDGRILSATISNCRMRWPCARIAFLVPQVAERQSADVDVITRVTDSSDAFYYALVEALSKAK